MTPRGPATAALTEKGPIEAFLRRDPFLHLYALGDLDEPHWPHTTWYGRTDGGELRAVVLVYTGLSVPTVLALGRPGDGHLAVLLGSVLDRLPVRFYAHLGPGMERVLGSACELEPFGPHRKMALTDPDKLGRIGPPDAAPLSEADVPDLLGLYEQSSSEIRFEPAMLRAGPFLGIRRAGRLVSAGGVHVFSRRYRVAALGSICTHPDFRGQGLASSVTAGLCRALLPHADHIGLNVQAANEPAVRCYEKVGFRPVADYTELSVRRRGGGIGSGA
jgi:ribosomal protein S18 acetylase RimI-like enzyme